MAVKTLKVGLFGTNGHQVERQFPDVGEAELVAVCGIEPGRLSHLSALPVMYDDYADFLNHPGLELVSICSAARARQYDDIKAALMSDKHVYAEKPLVMQPWQTAELLALARSRGLTLRDMSTTIYESPYAEMREWVASGAVGEVVQVYVQKSYPYAEWRPQDEDIDGGLMLQVGIHAMRLIEQVALLRVEAISALQTGLGNPRAEGNLQMAAGINIRMKNGAIGLVVLNYLNGLADPWCNDQLRIFGTRGFVESTDGGRRVTAAIDGKRQRLPRKLPDHTHFQWVVKEILGEPTPLLSAEAELRSLHAAIGARESAMRQGAVTRIS